MRIRILGIFVLFLSLPACKEFELGVAAYIEGNYKRAIEYLESVAKAEKKKNPSFSVNSMNAEQVKNVLPEVTQEYFLGWEAWVGSHFGLQKIKEGCKEAKYAFRKIEIRSGFEKFYFLPSEGNYWPTEFKTIQVWWEQFDCHQY